MAESVHTLDPRVEFVSGWGGITETPNPFDGSPECGVGTEYPLLVTADQMAEIFYRVKDATFSGTISLIAPGGGPDQVDLTISGGTPDPDYYHQDPLLDNPFVLRSYVNTDAAPANLTGEREIWTENHTTPDPPDPPDRLFPALSLADHGIVTGFSTYMQWNNGGVTTSAPSAYGPYGVYNFSSYFSAELELSFNGRVAFVDIAGNGNPFDPLNELWVGMTLWGVTDDGGFVYPLIFQTQSEDYIGAPESGYEIVNGLTVVLSSGSISCSIWAPWDAYTYSGNITVTATEWWPYAKGALATPVWNSATGVKIP